MNLTITLFSFVIINGFNTNALIKTTLFLLLHTCFLFTFDKYKFDSKVSVIKSFKHDISKDILKEFFTLKKHKAPNEKKQVKTKKIIKLIIEGRHIKCSELLFMINYIKKQKRINKNG